MSDCTEPRLPRVGGGRAGEGREGMPSRLGMSDCTEPRLPQVGGGRDGEGREGVRKVGTA
jgi:hypothetical protein